MASLAQTDWSRGVEDAWSSVATFVPRLLGFLIILGVGYVLAKVVAKAVDAVLERTGFDRAVERGGVRRALENSRYDASDIVSKLVFYTLLLLVLQAAFGVFGTNPISDMIAGVISFLPKAFVAIVIVVVASAIAAAVKDIVGNALGGLSYGRLVAGVASFAVLFFGVIAALQQIEVAGLVTDRVLTAVLFTIGGILVVAVGGGGIQPMRAQWEKALNRAEEEAPRVREQLEAARAGFGQPYPEEPVAGAPVAGAPVAAPSAPVGAPLVPPGTGSTTAAPTGGGTQPMPAAPDTGGARRLRTGGRPPA
ncbi:MAG TPA: hypothetical protein VNA20_04960 [Frankiaceae bacterium]|nr:hypothetical protein [Frankiaceae bacterium]